jgi:hypothetical protein
VFLFEEALCLLITKDIPAATVAEVPWPLEFKTLTAISFVFFAAPNLFPPIYQI